MDNIKQKAVEFLRDNKAPERATHVVVDSSSFISDPICQFGQSNIWRAKIITMEGNHFVGKEWEFFPISELTEQSGAENHPICQHGIIPPDPCEQCIAGIRERHKVKPVFSDELMKACEAEVNFRSGDRIFYHKEEHTAYLRNIAEAALAQYYKETE